MPYRKKLIQIQIFLAVVRSTNISLISILRSLMLSELMLNEVVRRADNEYDLVSFNAETSGKNDSHLHADGNVDLNIMFRRKYRPVLSGFSYCISSCSMILLNKLVLSNYDFNAGISLMFYQNFISAVVVLLLGFFKVISFEKLNLKLIVAWLPVNIIFTGMLATGMYSLKYINVAMVTILKNVTNVLTAIGELYIFRKHQNTEVWVAMFLMIISAISGGITDLSFNATGYTWQAVNCVLTASYSLFLRQTMEKAKIFTESGSLNEASMVLLNNLLSLPLSILLILFFGEWQEIRNSPVFGYSRFWLITTTTGIFGLAISFTSMSFLHQTSPTTYSLVGSLNKIPMSIAGVIFFSVPLSLPNFFSILLGLCAGVFFAKAKISSSSK